MRVSDVIASFGVVCAVYLYTGNPKRLADLTTTQVAFAGCMVWLTSIVFRVLDALSTIAAKLMGWN